jgi:hypothetical protein
MNRKKKYMFYKEIKEKYIKQRIWNWNVLKDKSNFVKKLN